MKKLIISASLVVLAACSGNEEAGPKNIILLIGDGMGEAEISAARNYEYDSGPGMFVDTIKNTASAIVISKRNDNAENYAFVGSITLPRPTLSAQGLRVCPCSQACRVLAGNRRWDRGQR